MMRLYLLLTIDALAVFWDFRSKRIPNSLIVAGFLGALAWQWCDSQLRGVLCLFTGGLTALLTLALPHYFRMLGAGDIKLLILTGGLTGPYSCLRIILFTFVIAALWSVAVCLKNHILLQRLNYFVQYLSRYCETGKWEPYIKEKEDVAYIHMSLPIFLGSLFVVGGII